MRLALVLLAATSALAACGSGGETPVLYEVRSATVTTPGQITEVPAE